MIEMGGEDSPHDQGSYSYQMLMNCHLDVISYTMARYFEDAGWRAVPISASNIWRYRPYKGLKATFAPDMSHIYASVAAGLTELGYSGLAMSPEYGPRNRFVSIITDAPLAPTPLLPGGTLCDRCGQCIKHCATEALSKEVDGEVAIEIEGRKYWRANKNLWRCAWGEHFGLDVEADIPEQVDEACILESVEKLGMRGGTMGCCIKHCLPKDKRTRDSAYSSAPIRRKAVVPAGPAPERGVQEKLIADAMGWGAESVSVAPVEEWAGKGVDLKVLLPDAESIVLVTVDHPPSTPKPGAGKCSDFGFAVSYVAHKGAFFIASGLEKCGYSGAPFMVGSVRNAAGRAVMEGVRREVAARFGERRSYTCFVLTSAKLAPVERNAAPSPVRADGDLTAAVKALAHELGADAVGVSSAARLDAIAAELAPLFDGELILDARETGTRWLTSSADVTESGRKVQGASDHLENAKSVIVLGARMPAETVARTIEPPAEAIGPYTFATYQTRRQLRLVAMALMKTLKGWGVNCAATYDLCGTGAYAANPRGQQPNAFCNRFAAVAAGLGTLTKGGFVRHPRFGANLRYLAIVVDAELSEDELADLAGLRAECDAGCSRCVRSCTVDAFSPEAAVEVNGTRLAFNPVQQVRCDWALRYGLIPDEGVKYSGSQSAAPIPDEVTAAALAEGMTKQDTILKIRPCVAEMCLLACPYARPQG